MSALLDDCLSLPGEMLSLVRVTDSNLRKVLSVWNSTSDAQSQVLWTAVTEFLHTKPRVCLSLMSAAVATLTNFAISCALMEACITAFLSCQDFAQSGQLYWATALEHFAVPPLIESEFVQVAGEQKCVYVLYMYLIDRIAKLKSIDEEERLLSTVVSWITAMDTERVAPPHKALLLWTRALCLCAHVVNSGGNTSMVESCMAALLRVLQHAATDKDFHWLRLLVSDTALPHDLRIGARYLAAFVSCMLQSDNRLRIDDGTPRVPKRSKVCKELLKSLEDSKKLSNYAVYAHSTDIVLEFCNSPHHLQRLEELTAFVLSVSFPLLSRVQ